MPLQIVFSGQDFGTNLALQLYFFVNAFNMFCETRLAGKLFITSVLLFHYFHNAILVLLKVE